jgi:hypothetical protein
VILVADDPPRTKDGDDANPAAATSDWYSSILAAKGGNEEAAVMIGFIPWDDTSCMSESAPSQNMIALVDAFGDRGIKASVCEPDYGPIFAETIETITSTCERFVPEG